MFITRREYMRLISRVATLEKRVLRSEAALKRSCEERGTVSRMTLEAAKRDDSCDIASTVDEWLNGKEDDDV